MPRTPLNSNEDADPTISLGRTGRAWPDIFSAAAGGALVLLGGAVILGWHTHTLVLVQVRPSFAPMQYNTALCFFLIGKLL